jgi:hypothetical protein
MKLLQVVSLENSFYISKGNENSDLNIFNSRKFVHVLTLKTFDSKVFYMFQGFHRL